VFQIQMFLFASTLYCGNVFEKKVVNTDNQQNALHCL